nr:hypothetical protein [Tanacetum cinerariifolium]
VLGPLEDEHILSAEEQPLPPIVSPTAESLGYVVESDPEEDLEEYEDDKTEDGPVDHPMDGGDDGDDDDGDSSGYDADDEDEDEEDEEEEEEDEHLTHADSAVVLTLLPLELGLLSDRRLLYPFHQRQRCTAPAGLPSPPLPPSLHPPPPVDHKDDIPESEQPRHKRLCLSTVGFRQIMASVTRQGQNPPPPNTDTPPHHMTSKSVKAMIDQALLRNSTNGDGNQDLRSRGLCNDVGSTQEEDDRQFVANENEKIDKYINGLQDSNYGNVKSSKPRTLDETIKLTNDLMDQKLSTYAKRADNKRKADYTSRNNHGHQQQPFKKKIVVNVYNMGMGERKPYEGSFPKCTKCQRHHNGLCTQKCHKCNKVGNFARDWRSSGNTDVANAQKVGKETPKGNGSFKCRASGHFKRDCPKLRNKNGGNRNAQGWVYAVGNAEKNGNAPINPDSNVVIVKAMIDQALLRNSTNGDGSQSLHEDNPRNVQATRPCFYADFMKCHPLNFKGNEGVVSLTRWIEKMESIFNISGCAIENQGELKKLEIELWNLKVKGNDVPTYTNRFQELTLICTKFVANENEKIDKYISGLQDSIYGNVNSSKPRTLDETIKLTNDLMDQKLSTYAKRADNKRKADYTSRNNHGHQQQPFKKKIVVNVYNMGMGERKPYEGSLPKCTKCQRHHNGLCTQKCHKCNKVGNFARDCRSSGNTNVANAQKVGKEIPKGNGSFKCRASGHFKRDCPKLRNKNGGNRNAQGWVYAVGNAEKNGNAPINPDSNVVIVISCSKAQEYMAKGCQTFLAQISAKKEEDKSKGKQLKDILIIWDFQEDKKEHKGHLKAILELLKEEKLYAKFSKCEFSILKVQFLGHVIDNKGIHVDPAKIESIKDWASPKTPTEIC